MVLMAVARLFQQFNETQCRWLLLWLTTLWTDSRSVSLGNDIRPYSLWTACYSRPCQFFRLSNSKYEGW